jgi:hypothetical protein
MSTESETFKDDLNPLEYFVFMIIVGCVLGTVRIVNFLRLLQS